MILVSPFTVWKITKSAMFSFPSCGENLSPYIQISSVGLEQYVNWYNWLTDVQRSKQSQEALRNRKIEC